MERLLCFGDSLTLGIKDVHQSDVQNRFTDLLGSDFIVIEECKPDRTPSEALCYFNACILSHYPFTYAFLMLGTEDCIKGKMPNLIPYIRYLSLAAPDARVIIAAPPILGSPYFGAEITKLSKQWTEICKDTAKKNGTLFIDSNSIIGNNKNPDGTLSQKGHEQLCDAIKQLLGKDSNHIQVPFSNKKRILVFGDSNTYGFIPRKDNKNVSLRFGDNERFTGILREKYTVIEEGLCGRRTIYRPEVMNGSLYLLDCLESHQPLNLVVLMLGTNDLLDPTITDFSKGPSKLIDIIKESVPSLPILLVCPPIIISPKGNTSFLACYRSDVLSCIREFPSIYKSLAKTKAVAFFDASAIVMPSEDDGLHLSASSHHILAKELEKVIDALFLTGKHF